mgnify:CR=1 FL=1
MPVGSGLVKEEPKVLRIPIGDTFNFEDNDGCYRIVSILVGLT